MSKTAFLFAGQGAQYAGMGKDLYELYDEAKNIYNMGEANRPGTLKMCFEGPGEELTLTENTQPCLFLTDLACASVLASKGVKCDCVAGFSLGEIPALAFSGALSYEEAFKLVTIRGNAMSKCAKTHPGSMVAALKLPNETVEEVCSQFNEVYPVNYNCPGQLSCAGAMDELDAFVSAIKEKGGRAVKLSVSGAFHTPYMKDATAALYDSLENMDLKAPKITMYSNKTGEKYPSDKDSMIKTISEQASNPVKWETIIRNMASDGVDTFIEVGAGTTLTKLIGKMGLEGVSAYNVSDDASLKATLEALQK